MFISFRSSLAICLLFILPLGHLMGQGYRDQIDLIRLQDQQVILYGNIKDYTDQKLSNAQVSLFDPTAFVATEAIPVDGAGDYLFTVRKGEKIAFLVEKEGYFPYYHEYVVPDAEDRKIEYNLQLPDGIRKEYVLIYHPDGIVPSNRSLLEELTSLLLSQDELSLWMPELNNTLGQSRTVFLDSLLQARGIEGFRLLSGSLPGHTDHIIELSFQTDESAEQLKPADYADIMDDSGKAEWTLQFAASKNKLSVSDLKNLEDYKVFSGKDGYYRYTWGAFKTRQEANRSIQTLKRKGFSQAFPKLISNLKSL